MGFLEMKGALKETMCRTQVKLFMGQKMYISGSYIIERKYMEEMRRILKLELVFEPSSLFYHL